MSEQLEPNSTETAKKKSDIVDALWELLKSTKLAIFLLIFISTASIIGTLVPQNPQPEQLAQFSASMKSLLESLGMFDLYHSGWFRASLALLCVNLMICSLDKLPTIIKNMNDEKPAPSSGDPERLKINGFAKVSAPVDATATKVKAFLAKEGGRIVEDTQGDNRFYLLNMGKYSRLGAQFIHFSLILIVVGSLIGNLFGYHGRLVIDEGKEESEFFLEGSENKAPLGFSVACKTYTFELNKESGMPGEFTSKLIVKDDGKVIAEPTLMVNHPYYHEGIGIFQSSYQLRSVQTVLIGVNDASGKEIGRATLAADNQFVEIPGGGKMRLREVMPDMRTQTLVGAVIDFDRGDAGMTTIELHQGHDHEATAHATGGEAEVEILVNKMADGSEVGKVKLVANEVVEGPDGLKFKLLEYSPNYNVHDKVDKMALVEVDDGNEAKAHRLFGNFPNFDKMNASGPYYIAIGAVTVKEADQPAPEPVPSQYKYTFLEADGLYATVLDVNKDPGVPLVWAGCIIMFIGLWMAFFWSHRKIWVKVAPGRVSFGGVANRNIQAFEDSFKQFSERFKKELGGE